MLELLGIAAVINELDQDNGSDDVEEDDSIFGASNEAISQEDSDLYADIEAGI